MENLEKKEAIKILKRLGSIDGRKHLDQILYLVEGMNSVKLIDYWNTVDKHFKTEEN
ncbi:MAG: hypothetical protein N2B06_15535 [Clostridium sp.]|jgi:hypothetical protein|tara:strand:+ start:8520 stop:8690 length:171 start_codon:yes stop_codon:yes gene_type:complete